MNSWHNLRFALGLFTNPNKDSKFKSDWIGRLGSQAFPNSRTIEPSSFKRGENISAKDINHFYNSRRSNCRNFFYY
jgi:hypothetical protein